MEKVNITLAFDQEKLNALGKVDLRFKNAHKVNLVRYADDFIVTAATKEIAEEAKTLLRDFLQTRGLELSEEKTLITHINDGFDMLGCQGGVHLPQGSYQQRGYLLAGDQDHRGRSESVPLDSEAGIGRFAEGGTAGKASPLAGEWEFVL